MLRGRVALLAIAVVGEGQMLGAGQIARFAVRVWDTVDVCGRRECVLVVDVTPPVESQDSLMGFNLAIRFDPEKLVFHTLLTSGTLAEAMDQRGFNASYGEIRAYAFTLTRTISGARPLVAFLGDYRQECPDTTSVQLLYVEFNEEFERRRTVVVDTTPVPVYARVMELPSRVMRTKASDHEWQIQEEDTALWWELRVGYDSSLSLRIAQTVVDGLPRWVQVHGVATVDSSAVRAWERRDSALMVTWRPSPNVGIRVGLSVIERKSDTALLQAWTYPLDSCSCITQWTRDSLRVVNSAVVSVPFVTESGHKIVWFANSSFSVGVGERLELYDLLGRLFYSKEAQGERHRISLQGVPAGIYLGRWHRAGGVYPVMVIVQ